MRASGRVLATIGLAVAVAGCSVNFVKRSPEDIQQLADLEAQLEQLKTLARLKAEEADELRRAKSLMDQELNASQAKVGYDERGLVTRLLDQVLFDSGKAELRSGARDVLQKVAKVLNEVPDQPVLVEGHTDNQPIKHSGWASNDALSEARAKAVSEFLAEQGVSRDRLRTEGYGERRPIDSNDTAEGRQQNRRVEIVIAPRDAATASGYAK